MESTSQQPTFKFFVNMFLLKKPISPLTISLAVSSAVSVPD
jgi:hypothetical protein